MYIPLPMTSPLQKGQVNGPAQIESPNSMTNPLSFLCPLSFWTHSHSKSLLPQHWLQFVFHARARAHTHMMLLRIITGAEPARAARHLGHRGRHSRSRKSKGGKEIPAPLGTLRGTGATRPLTCPGSRLKEQSALASSSVVVGDALEI